MMKKIIVLLCALLTTLSAMADVKISDLPAASALTGVEVAPVVQSATTVGATVNQIKTYTNVPAGSTTQVQINTAGAFGGDPDFTWTAATNIMGLGSLATPAILKAPNGSASAGASMSIIAGDGVGTNQNGGSLTYTAGARTGSGTYGQQKWNVGAGALTMTGASNGDVTLRSSSISNIEVMTFNGGSLHFEANRPGASFITFTSTDETDITANQVNLSENVGFNVTGTADNGESLWLMGTGSAWEVDVDNMTFASSAGGTPVFSIFNAVNIAADSSITTLAAKASTAGSFQVPSTGFTITIANNTEFLNLDPAGTLLAGTINLPAAPIDGQIIEVASTQTVTTLTVSGNGNTIKNAPTTIIAGTGFSYRYHLANTTWYRRY